MRSSNLVQGSAWLLTQLGGKLSLEALRGPSGGGQVLAVVYLLPSMRAGASRRASEGRESEARSTGVGDFAWWVKGGEGGGFCGRFL